jgi:catechol 2,3-dioxygenase-like lactoylglutathione lyase family enzyme
MTLPSLPNLFHVGWVVRDCAAAIEDLRTRLGAGPFTQIRDARFDHTLVHGKPVPFALKVAFGALGGIPVELLEPLDPDSPHAEFLATRGEGLHHIAYLVPDFDAQLAAIRQADPDAELLVDGTGPGNPVRWCYLGSGGRARGAVIELLKRTPQAEAIFSDVLALTREAK